MANQQRTKAQHVVPESYLRFFIKEQQLYKLDIQKVKDPKVKEFPRKASPGGICYDDDYYTIRSAFPENNLGLKKHDSHFVEDTVLTTLENKYSGLFNKITKEHDITAADAADLSDYVTTMKLRNPYWFEKVIKKNLNNWMEQLLPQLISDKKNSDPKAAALPDWVFEYISDELRQQQLGDANYARQFQLFSLIQRFTDERDRNKRLREKVIDCTWQLYIAPEEGPYFITTDNPGAAFGTVDHLYHTIKLEGGFVFYFPLSYRYALVFSDTEKDMAYTKQETFKQIHPINVSGETVGRVNDILIQVTRQLIIAADKDYLNVIAERTKPAVE